MTIAELSADHPITDGINDGFRRPDLAFQYGDYNLDKVGGDGLFSNFWFGPRTVMDAFAQRLVSELGPHLADLTPIEEDNPVSVSMCYWQGKGVDGALVGLMSLTEDLFLLDNIPADLGVLHELPPGVNQIACDGNDNSPQELIMSAHYGVAEPGGLDIHQARSLIKLLEEITDADIHANLHVLMDRAFPAWSASTRAPGP